MSIKNYSNEVLTTILSVFDPEAEAAALLAQQKLIDDAVALAVTGLKEKNQELLGKLHTLSEKNKSFEGLDPIALKELKDRLDQDEDAKLLAEGKKNVVIEKYTERMRAAHADELKAEKERTAAADQRALTYQESVLDNQIRAACGGLHKGAVEDALLAARQIFSLDAKGKAVQKDSEGRPVAGKDGSSPFTPAEWIEEQKTKKPHWFPMSSSGSGSGGVHGAGAMGPNFQGLSATERLTAARAKK